MAAVRPMRTMTVDGRTGPGALTLDVYAEGDWLAVTLSPTERNKGVGYKVTHKPTGLCVPYEYPTIAAAKRAMRAIAHLDWDFGSNWTLRFKKSTTSMRRVDKARNTCAEAKEILVAAGLYA